MRKFLYLFTTFLIFVQVSSAQQKSYQLPPMPQKESRHPGFMVDPDNLLRKHADQIREIAEVNQIGLVDSYKAFEFLYPGKEQLSKYMAQVNLPNELGHELIVTEIIKWFK